VDRSDGDHDRGADRRVHGAGHDDRRLQLTGPALPLARGRGAHSPRPRRALILLLWLLLGPGAALAQTSSKVVPAKTGGRFTVNGAASQPVSVSFALPSNLGHPAVAVGTWTGLWGTTPGVGAASAFVPAGPPATFTLSSGGRLFFWIGATVTTTAAPVGNYTSPLTLTVVYN
jgi:hypothetical protein